MRGAFWLSGIFSLVLVSSTSGALQLATPKVGTTGFLVVDQNQQPVANASIMLGYDVNNPFAGNVLTTDSTGAAALPTGWKADLPVTVQANGFVTETLPVAIPGATTIQLTPLASPNQIEIDGTASNFGTFINDGRVHFGLVTPALQRSALINFDMSSVISPQSDTISVLGRSISLPSNVTLPTQSVTYLFPIQLSKPNYRAFVREPGDYVMSATHGSFPLQQIVNGLNSGKSLFDLVNFFTFIDGGQQNVSVKSATVSGQDIPVNTTAFSSTVSVTAPTLTSSQVMLSLAVMEQAGGLLAPTDLKVVASGQTMTLASAGAASSASVLSLLMSNGSAPAMKPAAFTVANLSPLNAFADFLGRNLATSHLAQNFSQLSYAFLPAAGGVAPEFLPLTNAPTLDSSNVLHFDTPTAPSDLTPVATYIVLSEVANLGSSTLPVLQTTPMWEMWSTAWLNQIQLPNVTINKNSARTYHWDVMFLARPANVVGSTPGPNGVDLNSITHVTRNSLAL